MSAGDLIERIRTLESELDAELARRYANLRVCFEKGCIVFEEEVLRRHRELRTGQWAYICKARPLIVLTAPSSTP